MQISFDCKNRKMLFNFIQFMEQQGFTKEEVQKCCEKAIQNLEPTHVPLEKASVRLGISISSLMDELKKEDCPYGFCSVVDGKRMYHISPSKFEDYLKQVQRR